MVSSARALIGHTGFVGSALARSGSFTDYFNSKNFRDMAGLGFDLMICAGISAAKWIANADPVADWNAIERLIEVLDRIECNEFILISTIDVYPDPSLGADESARIEGAANHPYGAHRLRLEEWIAQRFGKHHRIVRLPALFGPGLKKNALYDLLHDHEIEKINPRAEYQWYPTARLWGDIERSRKLGLELVNLFPEPLSMDRIIARCFPGARTGDPREPAPAYRLRTRHAEAFGGRDGYLLAAASVLGEIEGYVCDERRGLT